MKSLVICSLLFVLTCDLPSQEDLNMTLDECRMIVQDQIPVIVGQISLNLLTVCSSLTDSIDRLESDVIPQKTAEAVLLAMGCSFDGIYWDCSNGLICK